MKVKLEWLRELVDLEGISLEEIVNKLSLYSTEVEGTYKIIEANNIVVGYVVEKVKHPDSDRLSLCQVDVGLETLQIVCGAANVDQGQYVIVAKNGAKLPGDFKIKKTKIRGVESNGMICSLEELGLEKKYISEENQEGIYIFKEKVKIGSDALIALNLHDDIIELGLTANRGDLLNMLGVAIEVSAIFDRKLKPLTFDLIKANSISNNNIRVKNESNQCLGYYGKVFRGVEIKSSPTWLISRLIAFGIRPINNVVDITNYILALFGQPLHAFDFDKLGNEIIVRNARKEEKIITLDNQERTLIETDIVITNGKKPVAIAGVMGGAETEVSFDTKNIVIEAAVFDKQSVRNTATRLNLRSDASIRFEKGVDLNRTKLALDYATYLLEKYADAKEILEEVYDGITELKSVEIKLREEDVQKKLGVKIPKKQIIDILNRLNFIVKEDLTVIVPSRRFDIEIKEDLIEEIVRIYGYSNLPSTLPLSNTYGKLTFEQSQRRIIKDTLLGLGLNENITYSLVSDDELNSFKNYERLENKTTITLMSPISQEHKSLRRTIVPSLINTAKYCYSRKMKDLAIFEIGNVYYKDSNYKQEEHLSLLFANNYVSSIFRTEKVDFYLVKGIIDELFNKLNLNVKYEVLTDKIDELHPSRSANLFINNQNIGFMGAIHPKYAVDNDLDEVYVAEINLDLVYKMEREKFTYHPVSKVPSIERDIALVVDRSLLAGEVIETIKGVKKTNLSEVNIFDIYIGEKVASNQKSIAVKLIFTSNETLTDDVINNQVSKILKELELKHNAVLRK